MEDCPICLEPFTGGSVVIVCQTPHHRTCNDCFHNLYGLSPSNPMSGKCPECRAPLLKLDSDHPYPETLPMVTLDRINNPPPPVHNPPPIEDQEPPRQRRRTIAQFTADIDAVEDDGERGFLAAKREYHRLRNWRNVWGRTTLSTSPRIAPLFSGVGRTPLPRGPTSVRVFFSVSKLFDHTKTVSKTVSKNGFRNCQ